MKFLKTLFAASLACAVPLAASAQSTDGGLRGIWTPSDQSARIQFADCGDRMCGTLLSGTLKPLKGNNQGKMIIRDLVRQANGSWRGRFVGDGQNFKAKVNMTGVDKIDVQVCPVSFMCKTLKMTRVQ